jgi:hypothetical protein
LSFSDRYCAATRYGMNDSSIDMIGLTFDRSIGLRV